MFYWIQKSPTEPSLCARGWFLHCEVHWRAQYEYGGFSGALCKMVSVSPGLFFFIILVKSSVRNLSGIKVCHFCLSICLLSASLDQCIFSGYVQHIESVAITHTVIRAGCQTHFNSWAPSRASFDLKWAGPVKQLHNNLKKKLQIVLVSANTSSF